MRDEGILVDPKEALTPSERAVLYVLRRMRVDANLSYYMRNTEAFALLCEAEATRTGQTGDEVFERYSTPADHCKDDVADVVTLRKKLDKVHQIEVHTIEPSTIDVLYVQHDPPAIFSPLSTLPSPKGGDVPEIGPRRFLRSSEGEACRASACCSVNSVPDRPLQLG